MPREPRTESPRPGSPLRRVLNGSVTDYRVPRFRDVPPVEVVVIDREAVPSAGAGETPMIAVAPAVANALCALTGSGAGRYRSSNSGENDRTQRRRLARRTDARRGQTSCSTMTTRRSPRRGGPVNTYLVLYNSPVSAADLMEHSTPEE